jgi:hypothetical protein
MKTRGIILARASDFEKEWVLPVSMPCARFMVVSCDAASCRAIKNHLLSQNLNKNGDICNSRLECCLKPPKERRKSP